MGMEQRAGRFYYYEKRRVAGRVVSRYIGGGLAATLAAEISNEARRERDQRRREKRKLRDEENQIDRQIEEQGRILAALTGQCLRLAGFHQHKGQWRKKRGGSR